MTTDHDAPRAKRKAMRVATTLIGATAWAAAFAPAATAQTAVGSHQPARERADRPKGQMAVRPDAGTPPIPRTAPGAHLYNPDNTPPAQPYSLAVEVSSHVQTFHVCGWHPTNAWRCTKTYSNPGYYSPGLGDTTIFSIGGNHRSWDRGTIDVYWNKGGAGSWDTCNTNGDYDGYPISSHGLLLGPVGFGKPTC
jgi:hypothetical protein